MAARSHVQETNDRRLRPIYDYLDNGNNKMAIQQAEKLLRKHRDLHCAKVLKAIGLQRSGRQAEALVLGQEVALTEPADDSSLQALTILYRELHRPELVPPLYETAVKTCLPSEELQAHLFMAYARLGHFKKMQQAAMVLYKITPKNPYYFWAVMSLVMQALCASEGDPGKEMFLPLAERMISKLVKQGKVEAEAEVQLYLLVLDLLEKHDEALAVLEGPLGGKLCGELRAVDTRKAAILRKTGCWHEANELARRVLEHSPDDWPSLQLFLDSSFHLMDCHRKTGEAETSCTPFALMEFLDSLEAPDRKSTSDNAGRPIRGPSLARLQLLWRLKQDGREEELGGMIDGVQLLRKYLWQFGARPCCLSDIKLYLGLIQQSQAQQFISTLLDSLPNDPAKETGMSNATLALSNTLPPGNKVKPPSNSSAFICPDDGIDQAPDASSPHLADGKVLQCLSNGGFNASVKTEACNNLQCASDESSNNGTLPFGNLTPTHSHEELLSDNATSSSSTLSPISRDNPCSLAELTIKDTPFTARGSPLPKQSLPINKDAVRVLTAKDLPTNEMAAPTSIESPPVSTVTSPISSPSSITLPKVFPPFPRDLEALRRGECLAELARVLGLHLSLEADVRLKLAQTAALLFRHALTLDECLLHTDMRPGEGFCLLATHLVLDEWRESGQGRAIWRALGLLEWAVMQCPAAPQLRLAQLRLYGELGALSGSLAAYAALEPKHVQHESMGYLVMSQVPASGQFFTAGLVYSPLLKFHRAQHKETAEYIIQAFKFGSFAQVPEVVSFRERLSASLDLALARTELALLVTLMGITPQGNQSLQESIAMAMEGDRIPWDHLRDNRDFDISMNFEPNEQQPYPSDLSRSIETSRLWLRIRALTLRGVTIATSGVAKGSGSNMAVEVSGSAGGDAATADGIPAPLVVNGGGVEEASASLSALSSLLRELIAIYRLLEENQLEEKARENVVKQPVFLPADPPLRDFICSGTWRCHLEAFNLTHALLTLQNCGITHDESSIIQKEICGHFNALRDHFEDTCLACRGSLIDESLGPHDLRPQPGLLHRLAFAAETTCLVVVVMGLAVAMLRPQRSLLQRRRKKRKDPQVPQSVPALAGYQEFVVVLEAAVGKLLGIVGEHALGLGNVHYVPSPLLDQHQEEERANQKVVWENVRNSYSRSLEDIETILRKCLDTIKSHKL